MSFYVRSALPSEQTILELRRVMATIDSDLPLESLWTMEDQVRSNIMADRIVMQLSALFALLATILAMMGLFGVMAYSVTQRIREIGIRMALGADTPKIRKLVMGDLFHLLVIGMAIGIPLALVVARLAESQLYGVTTRHPGRSGQLSATGITFTRTPGTGHARHRTSRWRCPDPGRRWHRIRTLPDRRRTSPHRT